jgi:hypothetical protein
MSFGDSSEQAQNRAKLIAIPNVFLTLLETKKAAPHPGEPCDLVKNREIS